MRGLFASLDPRARLASIVLVTIIVASTARGALVPFAIYAPLSAFLISTGHVSRRYLLWRCLAASPFILLAAVLLGFQAGWQSGASVAFKGYTAALLLAFLTATTPLAELLWALRKLGAPESLNLILGMMYRYTSLLGEEYARLERARESRTVRPLGWGLYKVYGRQLGELVLRSWDRAERVHASMLSRGFTGVWPGMPARRFARRDTAFATAAVAAYLAARLGASS